MKRVNLFLLVLIVLFFVGNTMGGVEQIFLPGFEAIPGEDFTVSFVIENNTDNVVDSVISRIRINNITIDSVMVMSIDKGASVPVQAICQPKFGENYINIEVYSLVIEGYQNVGGQQYPIRFQDFFFDTVYVFGKKEKLDVVISDPQPDHAAVIKEALLSINPNIKTKIYPSWDMRGTILYAQYTDAEAIIQSNDIAISQSGWLKDIPELIMFAPMPFNERVYWDFVKEIPEQAITTTACDTNGKSLYSIGPALEFINSYKPANWNSFANAVTAGQIITIKKTAEEYLQKRISWDEVRSAARLSTGKAHNDTTGYGLIRTDKAIEVLTGQNHNTGVGMDRVISKSFQLAQNYPNPFNPTTTISYSLGESGNTQLIVYNVTGQEIKTLVNKNQPAGNYTLQFDASELSSGIYFYKLMAGNYIKIKKMILTK